MAKLGDELKSVCRADGLLPSIKVQAGPIFQKTAQESNTRRSVFGAFIDDTIVRRICVESSDTGIIVRLTSRAAMLAQHSTLPWWVPKSLAAPSAAFNIDVVEEPVRDDLVTGCRGALAPKLHDASVTLACTARSLN